MIRSKSIFIGWQAVLVAIVVVVAGLAEPACCQAHRPVLLLQQSPLEGGTITPAEGVHHFDLNTDVTLTAVAKPGYQFVCWLGDVSDPMASRTIVRLDAPKIVVAVFERVEYDLLVADETPRSAPLGGSFASPGDYGRGGFGAPGGRRPHRFRWPEPPEPEEPEEPDEFPVPVPEPATVVLLGLGSLFAFAGRRAAKQV